MTIHSDKSFLVARQHIVSLGFVIDSVKITITSTEEGAILVHLGSRLFYDNKKWSLNERVAKSLFNQLGKPEIDLFASRLNSKCDKYGSYKTNAGAYHVNAFSLCWLNLISYIFPPFSIVGRVLAKLAQYQVTALVLVPCLQTQLWFPQFVWLVKPGTTPLLIPPDQH